MDAQPPGEVLGEEPTEPAGARAWRRMRAHPVLLVLIAVAALGVGATVVVISTRPAEPVAVSPLGEADIVTPQERGWEEGPDGRPAGPPVLAVSMLLQRADADAGTDAEVETEVVGIVGPGVVRAENPPALVPATGTVEMALESVLDCSQVPASVPAGAYALRTSARSRSSGRREGSGVVELGTVSDRWAGAIRRICATWSARQDLTVTALSATVDPRLPRLAVELTVTNRGGRPASLTPDPGYQPIRVEGRLPAVVPAHRSTRIRLTVVLDRCDTVNPPGDGTAPLTAEPALSTALNLAGRAGPDSENATTGILLTPDADRALTAALSEACAGLNPILPLISPRTVRYDARTRELTVPLQLFVAPGKVRSLRLRSGAPTPGSRAASAYLPLWKPTGDLVPDPSGRLRITLRYRVPKSPCPQDGGYLPNVVAVLDVPIEGGARRLTYLGALDLFEDPTAMPLLCGND